MMAIVNEKHIVCNTFLSSIRIMRSEGIFFPPFCLLLCVVVALEIAESFQPRHRKFGSIAERRQHDYPTAEHNYDRHLRKSALSSSQLPSTSRDTVIGDHPWYSHPNIGRDRSHVQNRFNTVSDILDRYKEQQQEGRDNNEEGHDDEDAVVNLIESSKFLLISSNGMWHRRSCSSASIASPLYLTVSQLDHVIECLISIGAVSNRNGNNNGAIDGEGEPLLAWVGNYEDEDYWVINLNDRKARDDSETKESKPQLESILMDSLSSGPKQNEFLLVSKPLREFGDSLQASHDAGILATANGLVEFHKSHRFCSLCGGPTESTKSGASRTCTLEDCRKSVYPRIDSAAIMLVTSDCENYALLGRKRSWPSGRYSTLAGFCEVGETLEECCQRETYEESGVIVDPRSVRFAASQPWPFPRSLMVGFRAKAMPSFEAGSLPEIVVDTNEMEDIRWFDKDFVKESLKLNGSTALTFQPNEDESEFHVPGKASLARFLIKEWVDEEGNHKK